MSLLTASNIVVHLYYSFQLRPLAVVWQSVKLENANFLKILNHVFLLFLAHPIKKQLAICARLRKFAVG